ncbi:MAG: T9SS type A sorting domain-containing protein [Owenweeksia sp.]|nr:T9SS type A sorting domain-containing protein [Owenweeksia sp.]
MAEGGAISLSVFNKAGELVHSEKLNDREGSYRSKIDITEQPAGPYILVFEQNGKLLTQKILKN